MPRPTHYGELSVLSESDAESVASTCFSIPSSAVSARELTGGVTNKLYLLKIDHTAIDAGTSKNTSHATTDLPKRFLLRQYGHGTEDIIDRDKELRTIVALREIGKGPRLYFTVSNGMGYEFFPGEVCTAEDIAGRGKYGEGLRLDIAEAMARWHALSVDVDIDKRPPGGTERITDFFDTLRKYVDQSPKSFPDDPEKDAKLKALDIHGRVLNEIPVLEERLRKSGSKIVFSHNDLLCGNIVRQSAGNLVFIDYEYASNNYRCFDIGSHFCEYAGFECDYDKHFPTKEEMTPFLRKYLEVAGENAEDESVSAFADEVFLGALMSHLMWGVWGVVQAKISDIDFDYVLYAQVRIDAYFRWKESGFPSAGNSSPFGKILPFFRR